MATQISELTMNQKHWIKELSEKETVAVSHLETFEEAAGVDTEALQEARLLLREAYAKARTAVIPR